MKISYKGYDINVTRERSLGGWSQIYYSIFRQSDGFECTSGFCDTADTVRDFIGFMKERIDNEHKEDDPWEEKERDN